MIAFDLETTGLSIQTDRIIQIALVPMTSSGHGFQSLVYPGFPISDEIAELTKIDNGVLAHAPRFDQIAGEIADVIRGQTLVGFNCNRLDVPMLAEEFERAGVEFDWSSVNVIDVGELFKILQPRTLADAVIHFCGRTHEGAHDAIADARATGEVFERMRYLDSRLRGSPAEVAAFARHNKRMADPAGKLAYDDSGRLVFNTFRNKGVPLADDVGYAEWMLRTDMPLSTKRVIRQELERINSEQANLFDEFSPAVAEGGPF